MKIAIIVPSLAHKAPVLVARDLAKGFVLAGHSVTAFYFDTSNEVQFPCPVKLIKFFDYAQLDGFDVVHTHMLRPDIFGWCCKKIHRMSGKFVTTIHNIVEDDLFYSYGKFISAIFSPIWRLIWSGLDGRIVISDHELQYYTLTQPKCSFHRIYNGCNSHIATSIKANDAQIISDAKKHWHLIGACAVVSHRKGLEQVIKALPFLTDYAFLLIGDGPAMDELQILANSLGVSNRFITLGQKNNARDYMPYIDIYAMPSRSEGMGLALLEAVSAGVPAVCSDIPVFREIFSEHEVSFFQLDNIEDFVTAIKYLENNGVALSKRARERVETSYTQEIMVSHYLNYFEILCQK